MKFKCLIMLLPLVIASCSVYRQNFDCPPAPGIPCTSVSDLEQMVVETDEGPDIFLGMNPEQYQLNGAPSACRIWVSNGRGGGRFFYLRKGRSCCNR